MNMYESIFILKPSLKEEETESAIEKMKGVITTNNGEILEVENWGKRKLAYEVKKEKKGIFVLMRFQGEGRLIPELEKNYKLDDRVMKYVTVKLDKRVAMQLKERLAQSSGTDKQEGDKQPTEATNAGETRVVAEKEGSS